MKKLLCLPLSCLLFSGLSYADVKIQKHGLIALYQSQAEGHSQQQMIQQLESKLKGNDCVIQREGQILAKQGSYAFPSQNKFLMLTCDTAQLEQGTQWLTQLAQKVSKLTIQEGRVVELNNDALKEVGHKREFIIKISDYNNDSAIDRNRDLTVLQTLVATRTQAYKNEAVFRVDDALGMPRADEITMIYYDNADDARAFRANNDDVLAKIGAFNQAHLTQFAYFVAKSNR